MTPAVGDPAPPGGDRARAGVAHQRDLGQLRAVEAGGGGGERVDPEVGLAARGGEAHPRRMVERRRLVGHQRRAGDPAEVERRLVDREHAEVDEARRDQRAAGIDDLVAVLRARPRRARRSAPSMQRIAPGRRRSGVTSLPPVRMSRAAACFMPSPPRRAALRVSTSRQAMRMATPISTWSVMIERPSRSATVLSISTPRFIGPGCITIASGAARASRSG